MHRMNVEIFARKPFLVVHVSAYVCTLPCFRLPIRKCRRSIGLCQDVLDFVLSGGQAPVPRILTFAVGSVEIHIRCNRGY